MITVRLATLDDLKYLPEIYHASFGNTSSEEIFLSHFKLSGRYILVAQLDDLVIGYIHGYVEQSDGYGSVSILAVSPRFRQRGVGRQLLDDLLAILFQNPRVREVDLRVEPFNVPAILLYRKIGFVETKPANSEDPNYIEMKISRPMWFEKLAQKTGVERE